MADKEGMELTEAGTVKWTWSHGKNATYRSTMRRPTLGELRKMRELLDSTNDETTNAQETTRAALAELAGTEADEDKAEAIVAARDLTRAQTEKIEEMRIGWLREAFVLLADKAMPPDDDLPSWFASPAPLMASLMTHWQTRPLDPGGG